MVDFPGAGSTEIVNYWLDNKHGLSTNTTWNQTYKTEEKPFMRTMTRISRLAVPIAVHGADRDEETIIVDWCQPPRCGVEWRQSDISIQHQIWTYPKQGILQNACFTWKCDKNPSHLGVPKILRQIHSCSPGHLQLSSSWGLEIFSSQSKKWCLPWVDVSQWKLGEIVLIVW